MYQERQAPPPARTGRITTVLDIGSSKICCLIAALPPAAEGLPEQVYTSQIRILGLGYQQSAGIKSGVVVDMAAAEKAIRMAVDRAEHMAGVTVSEVIVSVTGGRLTSRNFAASIELGNEPVAGQHISKVLKSGWDHAVRDGQVILHAVALGYRLDDEDGIEDPRGMLGRRLGADIHAVTADPQPLRNLLLCIERCHLTAQKLVAAPYAAGLAALYPDEARLGAACIDIGAGTATLAVFHENRPVYIDAIAIGGHHVTMDLARALGTSLDQAERLKTLHGSLLAARSDEKEILTFDVAGGAPGRSYNEITRAQLSLFVRPRVEEIITLLHDRLQSSGLAPFAGRRLVLTGGAAQQQGLPAFARGLSGASTRVAQPQPFANLPGDIANPAWSAAVGLLLYPNRARIEFSAHTLTGLPGTGSGYLTRVTRWLKESF